MAETQAEPETDSSDTAQEEAAPAGEAEASDAGAASSAKEQSDEAEAEALAGDEAPTSDEGEAETPDAEASAPDEEAEAAGDDAPEEPPAPAGDGAPASSEQAEEQARIEERRTDASLEELLKAGAHFGHLTSRWHPKMEPYIFMERNDIHIVDLMQTQAMLDKAVGAARRFGKQGKRILFAGTKKQAQSVVTEQAQACDMPYVTKRWLGGMLTNFETIKKSIRRMEELDRMEREGILDKLKKKERLMRLREREKLRDTLGGIAQMPRLPGAVFVVDIRREDIAVKEANKLGIPVIAMVDTNCDPNRVEYPIPVNDDAQKTIALVTEIISNAIQDGQRERKAEQAADQAKQQQQ
jgi:small subunit ribosomal protein S2